MAGFENDIMFSLNADFSQADNQAPAESNGLFTNGDLWIGSTAANAGGTHINVGNLTSPDASVVIGYSSPNITLQVGSATSLTVTADSGSATPAANNLNVFGVVTPAGSDPFSTSGATDTLSINVQRTQAIAAADPTAVGLAAFDSGQFTVDSDGFVSLLGGGQAIDSIAVQTGTSPITPTAAGLVTINGAVVSAGTNPVRSDGTGANTLAIEVQTSQAIASTNATNIGLAAFDSAAFDVDANGFVQLNGGGIATTAFDVQANTVPGTDPVLPTASGVVTVNGAAVANHGVVLETRSRAANAYNLEVQYATTAASTNAAVSGVAHFNSAQFSVDANGFVSTSGTGIPNTLTGDSGGALSPTLGNFNILGRSGSKTAGSGSTITVNSPPFADQGSSTSVTLNSGSFATAAVTLTTPVSAGLLDGDLICFVATNGVLVIQLAATQVAHIGTAATGVAGTLTSTATGDSIMLRYQASTNDWWAVGAPQGNWLVV